MLSSFPSDISKEEFLRWIFDSSSNQLLGQQKALNWETIFNSGWDISKHPELVAIAEKRVEEFRAYKARNTKSVE